MNGTTKKERISEGVAYGRYNNLSAESVNKNDDNRDTMTIQSTVLNALIDIFETIGEAKARQLKWYYEIDSSTLGRFANLTPKQTRDALYRLKMDCHLIWYTIRGGSAFRIRIPDFCYRRSIIHEY